MLWLDCAAGLRERDSLILHTRMGTFYVSTTRDHSRTTLQIAFFTIGSTLEQTRQNGLIDWNQ